MFVHSLLKEEITYRAHGRKFIIKPGMNNLTGITKEELVRTFGDVDLVFVTDETCTPVIETPAEVQDAPAENPEKGNDVLKDEGDKAGEADQADNEPKPDNAPAKPEAEKKEDGEAVKTETAPKAPAKAPAKATVKKATGKKNK